MQTGWAHSGVRAGCQVSRVGWALSRATAFRCYGRHSFWGRCPNSCRMVRSRWSVCDFPRLQSRPGRTRPSLSECARPDSAGAPCRRSKLPTGWAESARLASRMNTPRSTHGQPCVPQYLGSAQTFINPDNLTSRKNARWKRMKRMTTGSIVSTTPAISGAQECDYSDTNRFSPNASVYLLRVKVDKWTDKVVPCCKE